MPEYAAIEHLVLPLAVALVAFFYSSIGHGGATGYLALAALAGVSPVLARPGALWMNCCVAGIAFWRFHVAGLFDAKIFWPLAIASVPCAWLGSRLHLQAGGYTLVLGVALLTAGALLSWGRFQQADRSCTKPVAWSVALICAYFSSVT